MLQFPNFASFANSAGVGSVAAETCFDAERETPAVFNALSSRLPTLEQIVRELRQGIPVLPSSRVGSFGNFVRLPNHYRSVSFLLPGGGGCIAFKGTEPLIPDFPEYFAWMLRAPFRKSWLPLALHFALDLRLPPGAMWIEECRREQSVTSQIQTAFLAKYGRLARLPVPLLVYELTPEQVAGYRETAKGRLSPDAFKHVEAKIAGGLGVEVYYYEGLPVRVADLFTNEVRQAFGTMIGADVVETSLSEWIRLVADLLGLGYMPYAPWHHGMGSYVDPGNACIDGGFSDLLTIVPFDSIPDEYLFWRSLDESIQMLAVSVAAACSAAMGAWQVPQQEQPTAAVSYVRERLRDQILDGSRGELLDTRLQRYFEAPTMADVMRHLREALRDRGGSQYGSANRGTAAGSLSTNATTGTLNGAENDG